MALVQVAAANDRVVVVVFGKLGVLPTPHQRGVIMVYCHSVPNHRNNIVIILQC